jgi:hypothetical protein
VQHGETICGSRSLPQWPVLPGRILIKLSGGFAFPLKGQSTVQAGLAGTFTCETASASGERPRIFRLGFGSTSPDPDFQSSDQRARLSSPMGRGTGILSGMGNP